MAIFIAGGHLVNPLTHHLDQRVFRTSRGSQVFQSIFYGVDDPETFVYFTQKDEPSIRGDGGALEIYPDGLVKIWPDGLFLAFITSRLLKKHCDRSLYPL